MRLSHLENALPVTGHIQKRALIWRSEGQALIPVQTFIVQWPWPRRFTSSDLSEVLLSLDYLPGAVQLCSPLLNSQYCQDQPAISGRRCSYSKRVSERNERFRARTRYLVVWSEWCLWLKSHVISAQCHLSEPDACVCVCVCVYNMYASICIDIHIYLWVYNGLWAYVWKCWWAINACCCEQIYGPKQGRCVKVILHFSFLADLESNCANIFETAELTLTWKRPCPHAPLGVPWRRIPPAALTGLKSEKVLSRHYEKEDGLDRLFSCFPSSPSSLPPSLPKLSYSPSLPLSFFPSNVLSLLPFCLIPWVLFSGKGLLKGHQKSARFQAIT